MPRKKNEEVVEEPKEEKQEQVDTSKSLIFSQLTSQYDLPWKEASQLIRSELPITEYWAKLAIQVARSFGLPLQGINVIPSKAGASVYVNSDGVRWRLHTDPRGILKSTGEISHRPTKEEPWFEATATVAFKDGSEFTNIGVVYVDWGRPSDVANGAMKSLTKAKRRAGVDAVGAALPIYEDYIEWRDEQKGTKTLEGNFTIVEEVKVIEPTNLAEFFSWLQQQGKTMEDAIPIVGDASAIASNVPDAVKKLKEVWK